MLLEWELSLKVRRRTEKSMVVAGHNSSLIQRQSSQCRRRQFVKQSAGRSSIEGSGRDIMQEKNLLPEARFANRHPPPARKWGTPAKHMCRRSLLSEESGGQAILQEGLRVVVAIARLQGIGVTRKADEEGTSKRGHVHLESKLKIRPPTDSARDQPQVYT